MKCYLMNKNKKVFLLEYNEVLSGFDKIYEVCDILYAPLIVFLAGKSKKDILKELNKWFKDRGIPSWREDLEKLLYKLNVSTKEELLNKAYGLSLSDQYWIKPVDEYIMYDDINFFDHEFHSADFMDITFSNNSSRSNKVSLITPNNTTDGMLKKTWIVENQKRVLVKGGYKNSKQQPLNEFLASLICQRLGFNHVEYRLDIIHNNLVSRCDCFINKDTELIGAHTIFYNYERKTPKEDYEYYIKTLEENGINNAREKLDNMFLLDYLIMNVDRHLNNFGIIRDVNTLKWLDIAPIFDNGQAMEIIDSTEESIIVNESGRFFFDILDFNYFLTQIKDIKRFDFSKLDNVVEIWEETLKKYQHITNMTNEKIYRLCYLLNDRINKLKSINTM